MFTLFKSGLTMTCHIKFSIVQVKIGQVCKRLYSYISLITGKANSKVAFTKGKVTNYFSGLLYHLKQNIGKLSYECIEVKVLCKQQIKIILNTFHSRSEKVVVDRDK